jgi:hypothetical protein
MKKAYPLGGLVVKCKQHADANANILEPPKNKALLST